MCGIIGCAGARDTVPGLIEGLRRLEYRGYDSAGDRRPQRRRARAAAGQGQGPRPGRGDPPAPDRRALRHRAHPLGHPRPPERGQRPSAHRLQRDDRPPPQRHRRELLVPQGEAARRGPRLQDRDGHRGHRPPRREAFPRLARGGPPRRRQRARRGLRRGLHLVARPGQDRRRPQRPAGRGRLRRGRDLPLLGHHAAPRPHPARGLSWATARSPS